MRLRVAGWFLLLAVMVSSVPLSLTGIVGIDCPAFSYDGTPPPPRPRPTT